MPSNSHGCGLPFPRPSVPLERLGLRRCASLCSALNWPRVLAATNANHSARPSFGPWVCASFRSRRNKSGAQPRSPKRSRVNPSLTTRELACRRQALGNERRAAHRRRSRKQPGPLLSEPQRRRRPGVQVRSAALPDRRLLRVRDPRSAASKRLRVDPSPTKQEIACRREALGNECRAAHRRRSRKQPGPRLSEPQRRREAGRPGAYPPRCLTGGCCGSEPRAP